MTGELGRMMAAANAGRHAEVEAWARPRAEAGDADGQFLLGFLVYAGAEVEFGVACEWLRRAAAQDHAEALYELSRIDEADTRAHSRSPLNDTMRARLRRAAELGSARAQNDLGVLVATGQGGFAKDEAEARAWYGRAARAGFLQAEVSYGDMCLRGEGGPADAPEGLAWLEKAAATELASDPWAPLMVSQAAHVLVLAYERGIGGVAPDPAKAAAARSRGAAADASLDADRDQEDSAVGLDAEGHPVTRPFAFANPDEAKSVLAAHVDTFRRRPYAELVAKLDRNLVARMRGASGVEYEASVRIYWSDQPNGVVSVGASIEDVGWRTYKMTTEFFSMMPDGTLGD